MEALPVANVTQSTFDQLEAAVKVGAVHTSTPGFPWGQSPDIFKAVMGQFYDKSGPSSPGEFDIDAGTNFGSEDQSAFVIVLLNGLDEPLTVKAGDEGYCRDSGDMVAQPYYDEIVYPAGKLGHKQTFQNQVPGRQVIIKHRRYGLSAAQQVPDVETFGCGCWRFERRGGFYGVGCAIALTSTDPDFDTTLAIAGCVSLDGAPGIGFTTDLVGSQYADLRNFYTSTADKEAGMQHLTSTVTKKRKDGRQVNIHAQARMTCLTQYNGWVDQLQATKLFTIAVSLRKTVS